MSTTSRQRGLWRVSSAYTAPVTLRATDWISALGEALSQLGRAEHIERLACERLPNGEYIINDLTHSRRYIVQQLARAGDLPGRGAEVTEEVAAVGLRVRPVPAPEDEDSAILAMEDATERTDPYAGWGMSLAIEQSGDLPSEERPIIETYNPDSRSTEAAPAFEDAFAFAEDDLSELPDESTISEPSPRRRLASAFDRFLEKRRGE